MQQDPDTQKNMIVAVALSLVVLLAWSYFFVPKKPTPEELARQKQQQQNQQVQSVPGAPAAPVAGGSSAIPSAPAPTASGRPAVATPVPGGLATTREAALKTSPRIKVENSSLIGSLSLRGGRIDDLALVKYHETIKPDSPNVVLFSPANGPNPYFADYGWAVAPGSGIKAPTKDTLWRVAGSAKLTPTSPVTMTFDNGQGQTFQRTISLDDNYMFTIRDEVINKSAKAVVLYPYARLRRTGMPYVEGFFILHEGLIGVLGEKGLEEITYSSAIDDGKERREENKSIKLFEQKGGWLGLTDKYWAAALIPAQGSAYKARLYGEPQSNGGPLHFQTDYILKDPLIVAPGATGGVDALLYAGAKKFEIIEAYAEKYKIEKFDLMVDWGWFHFITKPLYHLIQWLYQLLGNFGLAILAVTVLVKAVFFPLANKSYVSMGKMKKLQPQMEKLKERCGDDKARLQKEMMQLYKTEQVNPMSGCLPILLQIPVFFALYKVLFVTIDMRHAPFFGWIQDLSAPDPTSIFNLFGLLPWDGVIPLIPAVGVWPLLMGITMWIQMQLNPQQPDPIQQKIFNLMPIMFTFLLASFPAGLVIYWAWNNMLSIAQQSVIMKRQGVDIPLLKNLGIEQLFAKIKNSSGKT